MALVVEAQPLVNISFEDFKSKGCNFRRFKFFQSAYLFRYEWKVGDWSLVKFISEEEFRLLADPLHHFAIMEKNAYDSLMKEHEQNG